MTDKTKLRNYTTLSISKETQAKLKKIKFKILKERKVMIPMTKIIDELVDKALK